MNMVGLLQQSNSLTQLLIGEANEVTLPSLPSQPLTSQDRFKFPTLSSPVCVERNPKLS